MHELSLARNIVAICCEHAAGQPVGRVLVEVGRLSAVTPHALLFCFDAAARNTLLQGARLEIVEVVGRARCCLCGSEFTLTQLGQPCACGSYALDQLAGEELRIRSMELVEAATVSSIPNTSDMESASAVRPRFAETRR